MKTYLIIWFDSEGAEPTVVNERLLSLGFRPMRGRYDYVYDWGRDIELEEIIQVGNAVHQTLKGLRVLYKLETI
ncbi:MAG: hypothetical protein ACE5Z5_09105 [Candidatus Bathyarchaeia archaeon]